MSDEKPQKSSKLETYSGLLLAVFAAVLAITDLGAGRYGGDEMIAVNEKTSSYLWYQSKGIKHDITEGRAEFLKSLVASGVISEEKKPVIDSLVALLKVEMIDYKKEKKEILLGSSTVGEENWSQDIDGKYGVVTGAKEWEATAQKLGNAGDFFDGATLFLQLCIVMGAISIISPTDASKRNFFLGMIILGLIGAAITSYAFILVNS
jgi:hypothetical protein